MRDCRFRVSDCRLISIALLLGVAGCVHKDSGYIVTSAGQGGATVQEVPNPPRPARQTQPPGPTQREIELQRRVDELEAQSRSAPAPSKELEARQRKIDELEAKSRALENQSKELQAEIERLKREK